MNSEQKQMIVNHYKALKSKNCGMKCREMMQLISKISGIGLIEVRITISKYNRSKTVIPPSRKMNRSDIDDFDKSAIRRKVHSFWTKLEPPTISGVVRAINNDETLPNVTENSLIKVLRGLNFKFTERQKIEILTEKRDLLAWRTKYLISIRKFREEGRPIYYLDETWLNIDDCSNRARIDHTGTSSRVAFLEGKRLIVLHIGSAAGFVPGGLLCFESKENTGYHVKMNSNTFREWFEKILPLLEDNAVVVMDNAPYHCKKNEKIPTKSWKTADIAKWLISKGKNMDPTQLLKKDLMRIVKRLKPK